MTARLRRVPKARSIAAVCGALVVLATACPARAEEPVAPEVDTNPSRFPPTSARANTILIGAAVAAGWYGAAVGTSYAWQDSHGSSSLRIPVAGPFIALGKTGCSGDTQCQLFPVIVRTTLTVLSAVGQVGGVAAVLEGIFVPTSVAPPSRASIERPSKSTAHLAIAPAPLGVAGVAGVGIGVVGDF